MADDWTVKQGDTSIPLGPMTLVPATGTTFTLAGATVKLRAWAKSQPADKINATCTVLDPVNRVVQYPFQAADVDTKEGYLFQVIVTFPGGATATFPNGKALVMRVV